MKENEKGNEVYMLCKLNRQHVIITLCMGFVEYYINTGICISNIVKLSFFVLYTVYYILLVIKEMKYICYDS